MLTIGFQLFGFVLIWSTWLLNVQRLNAPSILSPLLLGADTNSELRIDQGVVLEQVLPELSNWLLLARIRRLKNEEQVLCICYNCSLTTLPARHQHRSTILKTNSPIVDTPADSGFPFPTNTHQTGQLRTNPHLRYMSDRTKPFKIHSTVLIAAPPKKNILFLGKRLRLSSFVRIFATCSKI